MALDAKPSPGLGHSAGGFHHLSDYYSIGRLSWLDISCFETTFLGYSRRGCTYSVSALEFKGKRCKRIRQHPNTVDIDSMEKKVAIANHFLF